jgi:hypothetical protein
LCKRTKNDLGRKKIILYRVTPQEKPRRSILECDFRCFPRPEVAVLEIRRSAATLYLEETGGG